MIGTSQRTIEEARILGSMSEHVESHVALRTSAEPEATASTCEQVGARAALDQNALLQLKVNGPNAPSTTSWGRS